MSVNNLRKILSKNIDITTIRTYNHRLIENLEWFENNRGINSEEYISIRKLVIAEIKNTLLSSGYTEHESFTQIKNWMDNDKTLKKQYNLSFGKYLENLVGYLLEKNNITVTFPNGSKECEISDNMERCKWFDISLTAKGLSAAADIKNATIWRDVSTEENIWVYNKGLSTQKIEDIKDWGTKAHKKAFLILCISDIENINFSANTSIDILDRIKIIYVNKLIKNNQLIIDNKRIMMHPNRLKWNNPGLILLNINSDGKTVFSLRDLIDEVNLNKINNSDNESISNESISNSSNNNFVEEYDEKITNITDINKSIEMVDFWKNFEIKSNKQGYDCYSEKLDIDLDEQYKAVKDSGYKYSEFNFCINNTEEDSEIGYKPKKVN